ncbi:MAG: peptidoglycan DD-metalloendopeptidase family protein [Ruthenibacterium sp.]
MAATAKKPKMKHREGFPHNMGTFLYNIGFQAEYTVLRVLRMIGSVLSLAGFFARWLTHLLRTHLKPFFITVAQEVISPWQQAKSGFANMRTVMRTAREDGRHYAAKQGIEYFFRGLHVYKGLLLRGVTYLLPISAAIVFTITVSSVLNSNYALEVHYDGELLGYIENETVYADAQKWVQGRIRDADTDISWSAKPTFQIVTVDKAALYTRSALADAMIKRSGAKITQATGVMVDNTLIGATTDSKAIETAFNQVKTPYLDPANPNLRAEFVQNVQTIPGLYSTNSLIDASELMDKLEGRAPFTLQDGSTAVANLLRVKQVSRVTFRSEIPFASVRVDDPDLTWGKKEVAQTGVNGLEEIVQDITVIDGVTVSATNISVTPISDSIPEIVHYGVQSKYGVAGDVGDGNLIWPVPEYRDISRGMAYGHRGLDITGKKGTPILAADNGVAEFAGSGAGTGNWSYGNLVKLDHGNGITTLYGHCTSVVIQTGEYVTKGQVIAYMGSTGVSTGNHCHFEVTKDGVLSNPYNFVTAPR